MTIWQKTFQSVTLCGQWQERIVLRECEEDNLKFLNEIGSWKSNFDWANPTTKCWMKVKVLQSGEKTCEAGSPDGMKLDGGRWKRHFSTKDFENGE